jgi:hypothetical protein
MAIGSSTSHNGNMRRVVVASGLGKASVTTARIETNTVVVTKRNALKSRNLVGKNPYI